MKDLSAGQQKISCVLKLITVLSAVVGIFLSAYAGRKDFMGGSRFLMYFTIQSNILIAIICAIGLFLILGKKKISKTWYVVKFVGTVSITLTGFVFGFMLAPLLGANAWNIQNTLTHLIVPVVAVLDFFVIAPSAGIAKKNVIFVTIPPLLYAVYAGIGYVRGWEFSPGNNYPYFFLNWGSAAGAFGFSSELPYMGTVWWILALLAFLMVVGYCYLVIADLIGKIIHRG
ncbi:Pr6Pr family membrane protein [Butyrivibrio sp. AD3002]|uniref:Pr6Pr family membrane protein n=1 Tax=Butyrivibrio sp. AD3002 TaxID=1280670 RepID=UPI0003B375F5|nr:Pr6Pr family membrane protein [Butyrivibrio sp. AD3002]